MSRNAIYAEVANLAPTPNAARPATLPPPNFLTSSWEKELRKHVGDPQLANTSDPLEAVNFLLRLDREVLRAIQTYARTSVTTTNGYLVSVVADVTSNPLGCLEIPGSDGLRVKQTFSIWEPPEDSNIKPSLHDLENPIGTEEAKQKAQARLALRQNAHHLATYALVEMKILDEPLTQAVRKALLQRCSKPQQVAQEVFGWPCSRQGINANFLRKAILAKLRYRTRTPRDLIRLLCLVRTESHTLHLWFEEVLGIATKCNQEIYAASGKQPFKVDDPYLSILQEREREIEPPSDQENEETRPPRDRTPPQSTQAADEKEDPVDEDNEGQASSNDEEETQEGEEASGEGNAGVNRQAIPFGPNPAREELFSYYGIPVLVLWDICYRQTSESEQIFVLKKLGEWGVQMSEAHGPGQLSWNHLRKLIEVTQPSKLAIPPTRPTLEELEAFQACAPRLPRASFPNANPDKRPPKQEPRDKRKLQPSASQALRNVKDFKAKQGEPKGEGKTKLEEWLLKNEPEQENLKKYRKQAQGPCNICPVIRMAMADDGSGQRVPLKKEDADRSHTGQTCVNAQRVLRNFFGHAWGTAKSTRDSQDDSTAKRHKAQQEGKPPRSSYAGPKRGRGRGGRGGRGKGRGGQ